MLLSEGPQQPLAALRWVLIEDVGEENLCATMEDALARAHEELEVRRLLGDGAAKREAVA